jgi:hypothetical protein
MLDAPPYHGIGSCKSKTDLRGAASYDTLIQTGAFLVLQGKPTDLTTLICGGSSMYLLFASAT